jgi:hypothetical protein
MRPGGEAEVRVGLAADVEVVGAGERPRIAVGGGEEEQARLAGRAGDAVDFRVIAWDGRGEGDRADQP